MEEKTNMSEVVSEVKNATEDELKAVIEQHFERVRTQGMKIGATYLAAAVAGAIDKNLKDGMKSSHRDFERAIKRIVEIVSVQLTQQNDSIEVEEGTTEEVTND